MTASLTKSCLVWDLPRFVLQNSCSHIRIYMDAICSLQIKHIWMKPISLKSKHHYKAMHWIPPRIQTIAKYFPSNSSKNSQIFKWPSSFQILQEISCSTNLDAKESKFHPQLFKKCINRWLVVQKCTSMFRNPNLLNIQISCKIYTT